MCSPRPKTRKKRTFTRLVCRLDVRLVRSHSIARTAFHQYLWISRMFANILVMNQPEWSLMSLALHVAFVTLCCSYIKSLLHWPRIGKVWRNIRCTDSEVRYLQYSQTKDDTAEETTAYHVTWLDSFLGSLLCVLFRADAHLSAVLFFQNWYKFLQSDA